MGSLVQQVVDIARFTGDNIVMPRWGKAERLEKPDGSPYSEVDLNAHEYISASLRTLTPDIPVISEEASEEENRAAHASSSYWLVDPLDASGTFLEGQKYGDTAGFSIPIALIENNKPVLGVIYLPAQKTIFFTGDDGNAYMQKNEASPQQVTLPQSLERGQIRTAVPWREEQRPKTVNGHDYTPVNSVGAEQGCKVLMGEADLVWVDNMISFSHWDIAATQALIEAAGGGLFDKKTGLPLSYGNENFELPAFAAGHPDVLRQIRFNPIERQPVTSLENNLMV